MAPSVTYLGHKIDKDGIHLMSVKVRVVQKAQVPKSVTEFKAYLTELLWKIHAKSCPHNSSSLPCIMCLHTSWQWIPQAIVKVWPQRYKWKHFIPTQPAPLLNLRVLLLCCWKSMWLISHWFLTAVRVANEPNPHPSHKVMHHKPGPMGVVDDDELALMVLQEAPWKLQKHFALVLYSPFLDNQKSW